MLPALPGESTVSAQSSTLGPTSCASRPAASDRGGLIAPYPELRVEVDAAFNAWSSTNNR